AAAPRRRGRRRRRRHRRPQPPRTRLGAEQRGLRWWLLGGVQPPQLLDRQEHPTDRWQLTALGQQLAALEQLPALERWHPQARSLSALDCCGLSVRLARDGTPGVLADRTGHRSVESTPQPPPTPGAWL